MGRPILTSADRANTHGLRCFQCLSQVSVGQGDIFPPTSSKHPNLLYRATRISASYFAASPRSLCNTGWPRWELGYGRVHSTDRAFLSGPVLPLYWPPHPKIWTTTPHRLTWSYLYCPAEGLDRALAGMCRTLHQSCLLSMCCSVPYGTFVTPSTNAGTTAPAVLQFRTGLWVMCWFHYMLILILLKSRKNAHFRELLSQFDPVVEHFIYRTGSMASN